VLRERSRGLMPPIDLDEHNRSLDLARAALSPADFSTAWEQGIALSMEDAISEASVYDERAFRD